jgi:hypothetical protein
MWWVYGIGYEVMQIGLMDFDVYYLFNIYVLNIINYVIAFVHNLYCFWCKVVTGQYAEFMIL